MKRREEKGKGKANEIKAKEIQKDLMLKVPVSDDKSQIKSKIFESKIGAIFERKYNFQCNIVKNLFILIIFFKPHYKLKKS